MPPPLPARDLQSPRRMTVLQRLCCCIAVGCAVCSFSAARVHTCLFDVYDFREIDCLICMQNQCTAALCLKLKFEVSRLQKFLITVFGADDH
jgi:hypothetical protein